MSTHRRARIAFVHSGSFFHLACLADPAIAALDVGDVYAPELTPGGLDDYDAVYLAARQHPAVMASIAPVIVDFLDRPGARTVVDGENQVGDWLPGTAFVRRGTNFWAWRVGEDVGRRSVHPEHPLWQYLSHASVHWHYHGVLAPPPGATPLVVLEPTPGPERQDPWGLGYTALPDHPNVLLYHDDATFGGEVLVNTWDAAYHHGSGFMPGASQYLYRSLDWLGDVHAGA